jgi:F-type H+-transporting ATPase subunit epsilon
MRLVIATPLSIVTEAEEIRHLRAEDETGAFGILPGHADFLTVLDISVVTWRDGKGAERYVAVRGGVLEVVGGDRVRIATRDAVPGADLGRLETDVLARFRREEEEERTAHADAERLYLAAIRQIVRYLRPDRTPPEAAGSLQGFEP